MIASCSYENPSAAITGLSITLNVMGQMNSFGGSLRPTTMHGRASDVVLAALAVVSTSFQSAGGAGRGHDVVFRSLGVIAGAPLAARVSCAASATSAACLRANKAATCTGSNPGLTGCTKEGVIREKADRRALAVLGVLRIVLTW